MRRIFGCGLVLVVAACSGGGGGSSSGNNGPPGAGGGGGSRPNWQCTLTGLNSDGCACFDVKPGYVQNSRSPVDSCVGYDCCLLTRETAQATLGSCECLAQSTSCQAEAASRPGASVVAQCPPPGETAPPSTACSKVEESCRFDYLAQRGLDGCCAGTICRANAANIPVCQSASADQVALAQQCTKVARASNINSTTLATQTVRTNQGAIHLDKVQFAFYGVGPGGCLNALDMTFSGPAAGPSSCSFELKAELRSGRLVPTTVSGDLSGCEGYTGTGLGGGFISVTDPAAIPFELTFSGLSCDGSLIFESYCEAGAFDWHLTGSLSSGLSSIPPLTFEDQHLVANGVLCAEEPKGACPTG